jgi:phospholipid/cholesterol/gamma-HCH transport system substrate-binding protein
METKANHVLIGLFTLGVIAAVLLFILWASKYATQGTFHEYDIEFNENEAVTGLSVGGVVQYNGIEVGNVRDLHLDPHDARRVIARVRVKADTPIKVDTVAELALQSLATGVAFIQFSGGSPASRMLVSNDPMHVPLMYAQESAFAKLLNSSEGIATTASNVLDHINKILSEENTQRIGKTLANLQSITDTVNAQREDIATILKSARDASNDLKQTLAQANQLMGGINKQVGGNLPEMIKHLDQSLAQLDSLTHNADDLLKADRGAIDNFSNQGLAQLGPTLSQMRQVLRDINRLTSKLDENPAGYLLGRNTPEEFQPK